MTDPRDARIAELERRVAALERTGKPLQPIKPDPMPWGMSQPFVPSFGNSCPTCGVKLDAVMGYVCSRGADCPTGLAGPTCSVLDACGTSGCKVSGV